MKLSISGGSWKITESESSEPGNQAFEITHPTVESEVKASVYDLLDSDSVEVSLSTQLPDGIPTNDRLEPVYGNLKQSHVWTETPGEYGLTAAIWKFNGTDGQPDSWKYLFHYGMEGHERAHYILIEATIDEFLDVRYYLKWNSPGSEDGVLMAWINDELVIDEHDVVWSQSGTKPEGVWVGGNFSRGATDPA